MKKSLSLITVSLFLPFYLYAQDMTTVKAVDQLGLSEVAATFSQDKIAAATGSKNGSASDALLIDMGVINKADLTNQASLNQKLTNYVNDYQHTDEQYIGNISDKNIAERVLKAWNDSTIVKDKKVINALNEMVDKGYSVGYNVVDLRNDSHFDKQRMIRYGHNDIKHAIQLITLMKTEGFDAKVQLIPKASAFLYLKEWGKQEYPITSLPSGKMVAIVKEYNIDFEFPTIEQKQAFMSLINKYAEKHSENQKGLLHESWWQPFYRSYTKLDGYKHITENLLTLGHYQADLAVLPENAAKQVDQIRGMTDKFTVQSVDVWVNPSFYRYLFGKYK